MRAVAALDDQLGAWKGIVAARVIGIEMRTHEIVDVLGLNGHPRQLMDDIVLLVKARIGWESRYQSE